MFSLRLGGATKGGTLLFYRLCRQVRLYTHTLVLTYGRSPMQKNEKIACWLIFFIHFFVVVFVFLINLILHYLIIR